MKTPSPKKSAKKQADPKPHNPGEFLQETIVVAAKLSTEIDAMSLKLETLKSAIRDHALPLMGDTNSLAIDTELGKAHIVKVKDHLVLAPGVDADVLERVLPKDLWNTFFVMKPQIRGTATAAFLRLNEEQRGSLGDPAPFVLAPRLAQVRLPK